MTIGVVQQVGTANQTVTHSTHTVTLPLPPTVGNLLVVVATAYPVAGGVATSIEVPTGWTARVQDDTSTTKFLIASKVACPGESSSLTISSIYPGFAPPTFWLSNVHLYEFNGGWGGATATLQESSAATHTVPSITPTGGAEALILSHIQNVNAYPRSGGPSGGYTADQLATQANTGSDSQWLHGDIQHVSSASGSYNPGTMTYAVSGSWTNASIAAQFWVKAAFDTAPCLAIAPVAGFTSAPTLKEEGGTVTFTDTSVGTVTSWAWTFGDGNTSTSQNPTHVYSVPGTYSVTLTVTNAYGSDSVSHDVTIVASGTPDPPEPAGVLLEIYAADPGSARWDVAKWDEDTWGSAGWQDVTPYGVTVDIAWGSTRPELGILSIPDAASWAVDYYDPDRILDPANQSGPYFGDLLPFLPIRVSHRSLVIKQGFATGIAHYYAKGERYGYMRGADSITILANAMVPSDTALSDTLYARAVDAIAAAGLSVSVAAPLGTDPPVTPWVTGTREWSAWDWIKDAAQEVLHIPVIGNTGTVSFRPWATPLARGRVLGSPELIDLQAVVDYSGNYSVVQAREDVSTIIERALTPPPRYGARTYTRDEDTLNPGDWAEAVLADRGLPSLLWKPGDMRPLTAVSVELLATIEAVEQVALNYPEAAIEPIFASGIVVGGNIHIEGKRDDAAIWRFQFELAQTATEPLIETGGDPLDYLLRTGGGEYLYPTGSA